MAPRFCQVDTADGMRPGGNNFIAKAEIEQLAWNGLHEGQPRGAP